MKERIQKVLARAGHGSRRQIESLIAGGRIVINGTAAALGESLAAGDRVSIDGQRYRVVDLPGTLPRVLAYHKPEGEICTRRDEQGRATVFDRLPRLRRGRWISVGRLDFNTAGLLLFSDDGELVNRLTHPSGGVEREYAVRVRGEPSDEQLARLTGGIELDGESARFERVDFGGGEGANRWYHVVLTEGRNREVRRMWEAIGVSVSRLIRVRYGSQSLPRSLRIGTFRDLAPAEVAALLSEAGLAGAAPPQLTVQREKRAHRR